MTLLGHPRIEGGKAWKWLVLFVLSFPFLVWAEEELPKYDLSVDGKVIAPSKGEFKDSRIVKLASIELRVSASKVDLVEARLKELKDVEQRLKLTGLDDVMGITPMKIEIVDIVSVVIDELKLKMILNKEGKGARKEIEIDLKGTYRDFIVIVALMGDFRIHIIDNVLALSPLTDDSKDRVQDPKVEF